MCAIWNPLQAVSPASRASDPTRVELQPGRSFTQDLGERLFESRKVILLRPALDGGRVARLARLWRDAAPDPRSRGRLFRLLRHAKGRASSGLGGADTLEGSVGLGPASTGRRLIQCGRIRPGRPSPRPIPPTPPSCSCVVSTHTIPPHEPAGCARAPPARTAALLPPCAPSLACVVSTHTIPSHELAGRVDSLLDRRPFRASFCGT